MLGSILVFLLILSILILVHELGHFIMARRAGIWVEEFGFGLPPRLFAKKAGETVYSVNLLPFGGFVKLHGEEEESLDKPERAFLHKDRKTRAGIIVAGVVMNFLFGVLAFSVVYTLAGIPRETTDVKIVDLSASSPAQTGGLLVGDIVRSVDKEKVESVEAFVKLVEQKKGKKVTLEIKRGNVAADTLKIVVTPRESPPQGEGPLGVTITTTEIYYPPAWQRPFIGIYYGLKETFFWGKTVVLGFVKVFADLAGRKIPEGISGPVGIFAVASQATKFGILAVTNFIGILSINLAILNIIPFPALDGGRLLFIGIEALLGKKVLPKVESFIHTAGMIILLILLLAITAHDIQSIISAGGISGFLNKVLK